MSKTDSAMLDRALECALDGTAVLFLGAGISSYSLNENGVALPSGTALAGILAGDLQEKDKPYNLGRIAQFYRRKKGARALCDLLNSRLRVAKVSPKLEDFIQIPWKAVYTTNYDNAAELCLPTWTSLTHKSVPTLNGQRIVHLNGALTDITPATIDEDIILTDWSYANSEFPTSKWADVFRTDLQLAKAIIFVGYSLADLDISRLLVADDSLRAKIVFVVSEDTDAIDIGTMEEYGHVYPHGFEFVAARIKQVRKSHVPKERIENFGSIVELSKAPPELNRATATILFDQFVYGKFDTGKLLGGAEAFKGSSLLVARQEAASTSAAIADGDKSDVIISGGIASGKTFFCLHIAKALLEKNFRVFYVRDSRTLMRDLEVVASTNANVCVIFDGYRRYLSQIEFFSRARGKGHVVVATERTAVHELFSERILSSLGHSALEVDVERLTSTESDHFDELLNFSGLWGRHAGLNKHRRIRLIDEKLERRLYRILFEVVNSEDVVERVRIELKPILDDDRLRKFFVAAMAMNVLSYDFWINDWQSLFGTGDVRKALKIYSEQASHFLRIDNSSIGSRSGMLSAQILNKFVSNAVIAECLSEMYRVAVQNSSFDDIFNSLRVDLMRYGAVEPIFGDENKIGALTDYYERIREVGNTRNNPDYWLQYGIAISVHGNMNDPTSLAKAELAFENAYKRQGREDSASLRRINNYYARFELQKCLVVDNQDDAFRLFDSASQKLITQIFDEEARHYPFKVGRMYTDIAAQYFERWSDDQKKRFYRRCLDMKERSEARLLKTRHPEVTFLVNELSALLPRLELAVSNLDKN